MRIPALVLLTFLLFFCATCTKPEKPHTEHNYPLLFSIVNPKQTILVRQGPEGPVYTVQTTDGKVIARDQTLEALQARQPEIYQQIKRMNAVNGIDASNQGNPSNPGSADIPMDPPQTEFGPLNITPLGIDGR